MKMTIGQNSDNMPAKCWRSDTSAYFYSRGKLLVTGEYLILYGALGLALPVRRGQSLHWKMKGDEMILEWNTRVQGKKWFQALFRGKRYSILSSNDREKALFLGKILRKAGEFSERDDIYGRVNSNVDFDTGWGLGSSSSLISNIAWLFDINPFALHFAVSKGSGYDIACARSDSPIFYRLNFHSGDYLKDNAAPGEPGSFPVPAYRKVNFNPPFRDSLYFAWTGTKQDSALSVEQFQFPGNRSPDICEVSRITREIANVETIHDFIRLLDEHNRIVALLLDEIPVHYSMFRGFRGFVKSLGAWGGDFVMIIWEGEKEKLYSQLRQKGIYTVFTFNELISSHA